MRSLRLRLLLGAVVGVSAALAVAGIILVTIFQRRTSASATSRSSTIICCSWRPSSRWTQRGWYA